VPAPVHGWPRDAAAVAERVRVHVAGADAVFASARGDRAYDAVEGAALTWVIRAPVTALRGAIGDFGAAGALVAAAAARAVATGVVPPVVGCSAPPAGLDVVTGAPRFLSMQSAVVVGVARGGLVRALRFTAA
jgi:3-oxoacyl-(acyl-carrier-protein) synthase